MFIISAFKIELCDDNYMQSFVFVPQVFACFSSTLFKLVFACFSCLLQYQSVQGFYEKFNQTGGTESLRYPNCDLNGLYVTKLCEVDDATSCWCIDAEEGKKRKGSDFGGLNSHFPLNCDKCNLILIFFISICIMTFIRWRVVHTLS